jgi:hypothetical protein
MIAALLLTIGLLLAPFGTFAYVTIAMTEADPESLRISKALAVTGRWTAIAGSAIYLAHAIGTGAATSPPMTVVLMLAAAAVVASQLTRLSPPRHPRPA